MRSSLLLMMTSPSGQPCSTGRLWKGPGTSVRIGTSLCPLKCATVRVPRRGGLSGEESFLHRKEWHSNPNLFISMKVPKLTLGSIPALVSSIVWGALGFFVAIYELIDFFVNVLAYPDLMDMNALFFLIGLTFVGSAILQWNKRKLLR